MKFKGSKKTNNTRKTGKPTYKKPSARTKFRREFKTKKFEAKLNAKKFKAEAKYGRNVTERLVSKGINATNAIAQSAIYASNAAAVGDGAIGGSSTANLLADNGTSKSKIEKESENSQTRNPNIAGGYS